MSLNVAPHFSLAPCTRMGDNPALSLHGGSRAGNSEKDAPVWRGEVLATSRARIRRLKKDESKPAFHSLCTSVEIAWAFYSLPMTISVNSWEKFLEHVNARVSIKQFNTCFY